MGVVYMLVFENLHYIGSTIRKLNERIQSHKIDYKSYLDKKRKYYCSSFDIIKNDNYEVIEIEEIENETKEECREREQIWIEFYGRENLINIRNANGRDLNRFKELQKIYRKYNKQHYKQYYKDYYQKNKK